MYLNEATLLNNVRRRYKKDLIYVWSCDGDSREWLDVRMLGTV